MAWRAKHGGVGVFLFVVVVVELCLGATLTLERNEVDSPPYNKTLLWDSSVAVDPGNGYVYYSFMEPENGVVIERQFMDSQFASANPGVLSHTITIGDTGSTAGMKGAGLEVISRPNPSENLVFGYWNDRTWNETGIFSVMPAIYGGASYANLNVVPSSDIFGYGAGCPYKKIGASLYANSSQLLWIVGWEGRESEGIMYSRIALYNATSLDGSGFIAAPVTSSDDLSFQITKMAVNELTRSLYFLTLEDHVVYSVNSETLSSPVQHSIGVGVYSDIAVDESSGDVFVVTRVTGAGICLRFGSSLEPDSYKSFFFSNEEVRSMSFDAASGLVFLGSAGKGYVLKVKQDFSGSESISTYPDNDWSSLCTTNPRHDISKLVGWRDYVYQAHSGCADKEDPLNSDYAHTRVKRWDCSGYSTCLGCFAGDPGCVWCGTSCESYYDCPPASILTDCPALYSVEPDEGPVTGNYWVNVTGAGIPGTVRVNWTYTWESVESTITITDVTVFSSSVFGFLVPALPISGTPSDPAVIELLSSDYPYVKVSEDQVPFTYYSCALGVGQSCEDCISSQATKPRCLFCLDNFTCVDGLQCPADKQANSTSFCPRITSISPTIGARHASSTPVVLYGERLAVDDYTVVFETGDETEMLTAFASRIDDSSMNIASRNESLDTDGLPLSVSVYAFKTKQTKILVEAGVLFTFYDCGGSTTCAVCSSSSATRTDCKWCSMIGECTPSAECVSGPWEVNQCPAVLDVLPSDRANVEGGSNVTLVGENFAVTDMWCEFVSQEGVLYTNATVVNSTFAQCLTPVLSDLGAARVYTGSVRLNLGFNYSDPFTDASTVYTFYNCSYNDPLCRDCYSVSVFPECRFCLEENACSTVSSCSGTASATCPYATGLTPAGSDRGGFNMTLSGAYLVDPLWCVMEGRATYSQAMAVTSNSLVCEIPGVSEGSEYSNGDHLYLMVSAGLDPYGGEVWSTGNLVNVRSCSSMSSCSECILVEGCAWVPLEQSCESVVGNGKSYLESTCPTFTSISPQAQLVSGNSSVIDVTGSELSEGVYCYFQTMNTRTKLYDDSGWKCEVPSYEGVGILESVFLQSNASGSWKDFALGSKVYDLYHCNAPTCSECAFGRSECGWCRDLSGFGLCAPQTDQSNCTGGPWGRVCPLVDSIAPIRIPLFYSLASVNVTHANFSTNDTVEELRCMFRRGAETAVGNATVLDLSGDILLCEVPVLEERTTSVWEVSVEKISGGTFFLYATRNPPAEFTYYGCDQFLTFGACIEARNEVDGNFSACAWCTEGGSCTTEYDTVCPTLGLVNGTDNPVISSVFPIASDRQAKIEVEFRGDRLPVGTTMSCYFDGYAGTLMSSNGTVAVCQAPVVGEALAGLTVRLVNSEGGEIARLEDAYAFYDCAALTSCVGCITPEFADCRWDQQNDVCCSNSTCVGSPSDHRGTNCPYFKSFSPSAGPFTTETGVWFEASDDPTQQFSVFTRMYCNFGSGAAAFRMPVLFANATHMQCTAPAVESARRVAPELRHQSVLTDLFNIYAKDVNTTSPSEFEYYDCGVYSTCSSCLNANVSCGWCFSGDVGRCRVETELTGTNSTCSVFWTSECPRLLGVAPLSGPVEGTLMMNLTGANMPEPGALGLGYSGTLLTSPTSDISVTWVSSEMLSFTLPTVSATYHGSDVTVDVYLGNSIMDGGASVTIEYFDCTGFGGTCGMCTALPYDCGWCMQTGGSSGCLHPLICEATAKLGWSGDPNDCPAFSSASPISGSTDGGTGLVIRGQGFDLHPNVLAAIDGATYESTVYVNSTALSVTTAKRTQPPATVQVSLVMREGTDPAVDYSFVPDTHPFEFYDCGLSGGVTPVTACELCMTDGSPECGWCGSEGKCTTSQSCDNATEYWLPVGSICPSASSVLPLKGSAFGGSEVTVTGTNFHDFGVSPDDTTGAGYQAVFTGDVGSVTVPAVFVDSTHVVIPATPAKNSSWTTIWNGNQISIVYGFGTSSVLAPVPTQMKFEFFTCGSERKCSSCISLGTEDECGWCVETSSCISYYECWSETQQGHQRHWVNSTAECPSFTGLIVTNAAVDGEKELQLMGTMLTNAPGLRIQFEGGPGVFSAPGSVPSIVPKVGAPSTMVKSPFIDMGYVSATDNSVGTVVVGKVAEITPKIDAQFFAIVSIMNGEAIYAETTTERFFEFYICSVNVDSCLMCISVDRTDCGFCGDTNGCLTQKICRNVTNDTSATWVTSSVTNCPTVETVTPTSGNSEGGSKIYLRGRTFVDGLSCYFSELDYYSPATIEEVTNPQDGGTLLSCITPPFNASLPSTTVSVSLTVGNDSYGVPAYSSSFSYYDCASFGTWGTCTVSAHAECGMCIWGRSSGHVDFCTTSQHCNDSTWHFVTVMPVIYSIWPSQGGVGGGTPVTVNGTGFVDDSTLQCSFGGVLVDAEYVSPYEIKCNAPGRGAGAAVFSVYLDGEPFSKNSGSTTFLYESSPQRTPWYNYSWISVFPFMLFHIIILLIGICLCVVTCFFCCLFGAAGTGVIRKLWKRRKLYRQLKPPDFVPLMFGKENTSRFHLEGREKALNSVEELLTRQSLALSNVLTEVVDTTEAERLCKSLIYIFDLNSLAVPVMKHFVSREVELSLHSETLFRSNSIATKMFRAYSMMYGLPYLYATVGLQMFEIMHRVEWKRHAKKALGKDSNARELEPLHNRMDVEVDKSKREGGGESLADEGFAKFALLYSCQKALSAILSSAEDVPDTFQDIFYHVKTQVSRKYEDAVHFAIGGFFFLRFVCPAMVTPESHGLARKIPTAEARRHLLLLTKVLQNLSNGAEFKKEEFMMKLNDFIRSNMAPTRAFFDRIALAPELRKKKGKKKKGNFVALANTEACPVNPTVRINALAMLFNYIVDNQERISEMINETEDVHDARLINRHIAIVIEQVGARFDKR